MDITTFELKRRFSCNLYKKLRLPLSEMTFSDDFVNDTRGDLYPILDKTDGTSEKVYSGRYIPSGVGRVTRLSGSFFPYASYEMTIDSLDGACGFSFCGPCGKIDVMLDSEKHCFCFYADGTLTASSDRVCIAKGMTFEVALRVDKFDVYVKMPTDVMPQYVCTFETDTYTKANSESIFKNTTSAITFCGNKDCSYACISHACSFLDSGVAIADMRPIRYENGDILTENGRIYLTVSVRLQAEKYQGILSWIPGTMDFSLCGALFFDVGDGIWGNDVASSLVYNRKTDKWNIWYCSFSHGHILAHAEFDGDVRFGLNVVDATLMKTSPDTQNDKAFFAKEGDEDPNFIFDEKEGKWYMTICRLASDGSGYKYFLFESCGDNPFEGYTYVANSTEGEETGGSIIDLEGDGKYIFACGNSFSKRADYRVYDLPDFINPKNLRFDYDDGGFRGWGTIIPVNAGTRRVYYHLTFDRTLGSKIGYSWSYGNIYCFEAYKK